jgi:hypothetical protein
MQTVNFNCPHCGNLMAVGTNLLGRNVRCPHCKQVVQAPAAAGEPMIAPTLPPQQPVYTPPPPVHAPPPQAPVITPAPPAPVPELKFDIPQPTDHPESIFGERHDEDLFGSEPPKPVMPNASAEQLPTIDLPPKNFTPPPPVRSPVAPTQMVLPTEPQPNTDFSFEPPAVTATTSTQQAPEIEPLPEEPAVYDRPTPRRTPRLEPDEHDDRDERDEEDRVQREERRPAKRYAKTESSGTGAFTWILLGYGLLMTILAGFFGYQHFAAKPEHPFKAIPDVIGEYEKANRKQTSLKFMPDPKLDVPLDLRVKLGGELAVGDLQVKPVSVTRQTLSVKTLNADGTFEKEREIKPPTLVLTLRVKNLSSDTTFYPNDPAFNRFNEEKKPLPYTLLQIGREYYGGITLWPEKERYVVSGHEADLKPLAPGEERDTFVTVAPRHDVARDKVTTLPRDQQLLWRVQLRRGLVPYVDNGKTVDISATTVIGVEFRPDEIK